MRKIVRPVLAGVVVIFFALPFTYGDKPAILDTRLEEEIRKIETGLNGVLGVAVCDLKTGKKFLVNEKEAFPQASSIKIAILLEVFKQAEEGRLKLDEVVELTDGVKVEGSGVLLHLGRPRLSLRDLCVLMTVLSDNTATNVLIERVGMDAVNARVGSMGLKVTRLRRKMMDLKSAQEGKENVSTPLEMMALLTEIFRGDVIQDPYRSDLLKILALPKESPLRSGIPEEVLMASKPGDLEGVRCDCGIVYLKGRPYVICVMATYLKDGNEGEEAISAISRLCFQHFLRLERSSEYGRVIFPR